MLSRVFPPHHGGSGRWFWEIYRRLPWEAVVVVAGEHPDQSAFDRNHAANIQRMNLDFPTWGLLGNQGWRHYLRAYQTLRSWLRKEAVTHVHAGTCLPEGFLACLLRRRFGVPYICYVHGEELNVVASSRQMSWMAKLALREADFAVANSQNTVRQLVDQDWLPADKVRLLHPGVDTGLFVPVEKKPETRQRLGWEGRQVILTVGRLQKRKGQDQLIRVLPQLRVAIPEVLYAIVGDGEERQALEALARECDVAEHVQFLGGMEDTRLRECYQQCDLFVLPNREVDGDTEGFGMVLLEAQACGKAVVAGDSGGTAETMDMPHTGLVVDCNDVNLLAGTLRTLLQDPARLNAMGQAAREWVVQNFDWEPLTARAKEIFRFPASLQGASSAPKAETVC